MSDIMPISPQSPLIGVRRLEHDKRQRNTPQQPKPQPKLKQRNEDSDDDQARQHIDEIV